jgi:hypothetical protein
MTRKRQTMRPNQKATMFKDPDGNPIIGFCLWCGCDFYTMD